MFDERASVYERLLGRFRSDGLVESYKNIDIEYRQFRCRVERKWCILNLIQRFWWNYGYNKEYVFGWSLAFMVFFSSIAFAFPNRSTGTYRIRFLEEANWQRSLGTRIAKAVMYTGILFFGIKLDVDKFSPTSSWWTGYVLAVYTVGLVCVAYMLAFVLNR